MLLVALACAVFTGIRGGLFTVSHKPGAHLGQTLQADAVACGYNPYALRCRVAVAGLRHLFAAPAVPHAHTDGLHPLIPSRWP